MSARETTSVPHLRSRRSGSPGPVARTIGVALGLIVSGVSALDAQLALGVQGSSGEKSDFGIGPRAVIDLGPLDAGFRLVGSFEVFFPGQTLLRDLAGLSGTDGDLEGDPDYWEANVNVLYTLGLPAVPLIPYLGGGLNIARTKVTGSTDGALDVDRTARGVNLVAGAELNLDGASPFIEIRYEIEGGEQWVVTGGLVF